MSCGSGKEQVEGLVVNPDPLTWVKKYLEKCVLLTSSQQLYFVLNLDWLPVFVQPFQQQYTLRYPLCF